MRNVSNNDLTSDMRSNFLISVDRRPSSGNLKHSCAVLRDVVQSLHPRLFKDVALVMRSSDVALGFVDDFALAESKMSRLYHPGLVVRWNLL